MSLVKQYTHGIKKFLMLTPPSTKPLPLNFRKLFNTNPKFRNLNPDWEVKSPSKQTSSSRGTMGRLIRWFALALEHLNLRQPATWPLSKRSFVTSTLAPPYLRGIVAARKKETFAADKWWPRRSDTRTPVWPKEDSGCRVTLRCLAR